MQCIVWSPGTSLEQNEREIITAAFDFYKENKSATAQSLGISVRTLENKLEKYAQAAEAAKAMEAERIRRQEEFQARARGIVPGYGSPEHRRQFPEQYEPRQNADVIAVVTPSGEPAADLLNGDGPDTGSEADDVDDLIGGGPELSKPTPTAATPAMPPTPQQRAAMQQKHGNGKMVVGGKR